MPIRMTDDPGDPNQQDDDAGGGGRSNFPGGGGGGGLMSLLPMAQSVEADSIGNKDFIAIVVSKEELDYNKLNQDISHSRQSAYRVKVTEALQKILILPARFNSTGAGTIYFKVNANDNKAVACVVAIDKQ